MGINRSGRFQPMGAVLALAVTLGASSDAGAVACPGAIRSQAKAGPLGPSAVMLDEGLSSIRPLCFMCKPERSWVWELAFSSGRTLVLGVRDEASRIEEFASRAVAELAPGASVVLRYVEAQERAVLMALLRRLTQTNETRTLDSYLGHGRVATLAPYLENKPPRQLARIKKDMVLSGEGRTIVWPRQLASALRSVFHSRASEEAVGLFSLKTLPPERLALVQKAYLERLIGPRNLRLIAESWLARFILGDDDFNYGNLKWPEGKPKGYDFAGVLSFRSPADTSANPLGLDHRAAYWVFVASASDAFWSRISLLSLEWLTTTAAAATLQHHPRFANLPQAIARRDEVLSYRTRILAAQLPAQ